MKHYPWLAACVAGFCATSTVTADDRISISGFMSAVGGQTLDDGERFLANYPNVGEYGDEITFDAETRLGIQFTGKLTEEMSVIAQLVARGADDYSGEVEWLYFSYDLNPNWTVQGGRKRLPMFYYSDYFDVGYSYLWIRPPGDTYTWQVKNYNGLNLQYSDSWGDWSVFANFYGGREDSDSNKLLSEYFFFEQVDEIWKDMFGVVFSASKDWFEFRVSLLDAARDRYLPESDGQTRDNQDMNFNSISFNLTPGNLTFLTEYQFSVLAETINPSSGGTVAEAEFEAFLVTIGYRIGDVTPYVSYSKLEETPQPAEGHSTESIGIRWDFISSAAFKLQYDKVDDYNEPCCFVAGDSTAVSASIDVVF